MSDITAATAQDLHTPKIGVAAFAVLILIIVGDALFYRALPGLNLFLFFILVAAAILAVNRSELMRREVQLVSALALASALPLLEASSPWGLLSALFGASILALTITERMPKSLSDLPLVLVRFGLPSSVRVIDDGLKLLSGIKTRGRGGRLISAAITWIVPGILPRFLSRFSPPPIR